MVPDTFQNLNGPELLEKQQQYIGRFGQHMAWAPAEEYAKLAGEEFLFTTELELAGYDRDAIKLRVDEYVGPAKQEILQDAREGLKLGDVEGVDELDDEALGSWLMARFHNFETMLEEREGELEASKQRFITRIDQAISKQGLPISREQVAARLDGVVIGFFDQLIEPTYNGYYTAHVKTAKISSELSPDELDSVVFHELLHAISGQRFIDKVDEHPPQDLSIRRLGLDLTVREGKADRAWLNEAVTELLTTILIDKKGHKYPFGSRKFPLYNNSRVSLDKIMARKADKRIYVDFINAALMATADIPARTLLTAYFAQDHDPLETDQLAGIHAERELQRAIKVADGTKRIAELKLIDRLFSENAPESDAAALQEASKIQRRSLTGMAPARRRANRRQVAAHTRDYQARIDRAKAQVRVS